MSIKAGNGYIYRKDLNSLLSALGGFAEDAKQAAQIAAAQQYARLASKLLDRKALHMRVDFALGMDMPKINGNNALSAVWLTKLEERRNRLNKGYRSPEFDWECAIAIYPLKDGTILLRLCAEKGDIYRKHLDKIEGLEEFSYHSGTDGSPEYSWEEWEKRGELWRATTDPKNLICMAPIVITQVQEEGYEAEIEAIVFNQPQLMDRVAEQTKTIFINERVAEKKLGSKEECIDEGTRWVMEAYAEAQSPEFSSHLKLIEDRVLAELPETRSKEDFQQVYQDWNPSISEPGFKP